MLVTKELIDNFFQNKCSAAETEAIVRHFFEHREELNKYLSKEEWDCIPQNELLFNPELSEKLYRAIQLKLFGKPQNRLVSFCAKQKYWMAAASFILVAGLLLFIQTNGFKDKLASNSRKLYRQDISTAHLTEMDKKWKTESNRGNSSKLVRLTDGTTVTLYKNSSISFPESFKADKREVKLMGDAFFEVAKNKKKPFTVYSGCLSTTALGTSFRVTLENNQTGIIRVKLYTGKVLIRATESLQNWRKDIFLEPGEQMSFQRNSETIALVSDFENIKSKSIKEGSGSEKIKLKEQEVKFDNASLPDVMDALSVFFNTKIKFSSEDISKMNFTGTISRTDDIKAVLHVIALMNGLESEKSIDGFTIVKHK